TVKMADQASKSDSLPRDAYGITIIAVIVPLFTVALAMYGTRIWSRLANHKRLNAADYAITVAVVSSNGPPRDFSQGRKKKKTTNCDFAGPQVAELITICLTAAAVATGYGQHKIYLSPDDIDAIGKC